MQNIPGQEQSYRESHMGKGSEYHAGFAENPRRAMIWALEQRILSDIVKRYLVPEETDHLDFACGTGRILGYFQGRVRSSTGVDVSASMLEVASEVAAKSRIIKADITREDVLADEKFDLITAFRFFPNAEPRLRKDAIGALYPKLRPGGYLVLNNHQNDSSIAHHVRRLLTKKVFSTTPTREMVDLIASAKLSLEKIYHVGIVPDHEKLLLRPRFLVEWIESAATRLPLAGLSQDIIYVCRKSACPVDNDPE